MIQDDDDQERSAAAFVPSVLYRPQSETSIADMMPGIMSLAQAMSVSVDEGRAKAGQYSLQGFEGFDTVTLIPFAAQRIRKYRPNPRGDAECKAPMGDFGIGNPGGVCADCPLSKWGAKNPKTGKSTKPACDEAISVLSYSVEHEQLVNFEFSGQTMCTGKAQGATRKFGNFAILMDKKKERNEFGEWYAPVVKLQPVPEGRMEQALELIAVLGEAQAQSEAQMQALMSGSVEAS
jgi:hypothetical protein